MKALIYFFLLILLTVIPANAQQPIVTQITREGTNVLYTHCATFDILETYELTVRRTLFFNQYGFPDRLQANFFYSAILTNSVTGYSITDAPDASSHMLDLNTGEAFVHGLMFSVEVPGEGVLVLDAGNVVFGADGELTVNGPHQYLLGGNALLCAVLDHG